VIVLDGAYDHFLERLTAAARDLTVGTAEDPDTVVGPLIDSEARARFNRYAQIAAQEGKVVLAVDPGHLADHGNFVGPLIVSGVSPKSRVAQEEIFGPLLAVLRARDLDEALTIANGTEYALTGGLFSRSPANIERVKREFCVGNFYINRPITGALVGRQPFGGFRLSGIGTKAGGSDYLLEFHRDREHDAPRFRARDRVGPGRSGGTCGNRVSRRLAGPIDGRFRQPARRWDGRRRRGAISLANRARTGASIASKSRYRIRTPWCRKLPSMTISAPLARLASTTVLSP
jgi:hypothetical protein